MKAVRRRNALRTLAALAALPFMGLSTSVQPQPSDRKFAPPTTPMRFSRSLIRELVGDAQIVVTRTWRVRFEPLGQGYMLRGEQIAVDVAVPPGLEALAELERRKVESGMFPIMLTQAGLIQTDKAADAKPAVDLAIAHAAHEFAERDLSPTDQQAAAEFLRTLQNSAHLAATKLPLDLFSPRDTSREDARMLTLPGGATGEILVNFSAQTSGPHGLLSAAERIVTTRIGDSAKISTERWTLEPIDVASS